MSDQNAEPVTATEAHQSDGAADRHVHTNAGAVMSVGRADQPDLGEDPHDRLPLQPVTDSIRNIGYTLGSAHADLSARQGPALLTRHDLAAETKSLQDALVRPACRMLARLTLQHHK